MAPKKSGSTPRVINTDPTPPQKAVVNVYYNVIDEVCTKMVDSFRESGVDPNVLQELKKHWIGLLRDQKVLVAEEKHTTKPSQNSRKQQQQSQPVQSQPILPPAVSRPKPSETNRAINNFPVPSAAPSLPFPQTTTPSFLSKPVSNQPSPMMASPLGPSFLPANSNISSLTKGVGIQNIAKTVSSSDHDDIFSLPTGGFTPSAHSSATTPFFSAPQIDPTTPIFNLPTPGVPSSGPATPMLVPSAFGIPTNTFTPSMNTASTPVFTPSAFFPVPKPNSTNQDESRNSSSSTITQLDGPNDDDDGRLEGEEDIGEEDDTDANLQNESSLKTTNTIFCLNERHHRHKGRWKITFKVGMMHLNGKDYTFNKANGDLMELDAD